MTIYEVKTHNFMKDFKVTKPYYYQCQVEMFAWKLDTGKIPRLYIAAYGLIEQEYEDYSGRADEKRISFHKIDYDKEFINSIYLPSLKQLCKALRKGKFPR